jgi:phosphinothricin acetyltransferase
VRRIYAPYVAERATSFETAVPDESEIAHRIASYAERYPWLVFESHHDILGYAYASSHRARQAYQWCVEVSVYIDSAAHRRGLGRALYLALFHVLREQGYVNAYAGITLPNAASVALHEAVGFAPVGVYPRIGFKFNRWHDVLWLHLRLREDATPVPEPRSPAGVWSDAGRVLEECAQLARVG